MAKIKRIADEYYFDAEDGIEPIKCKTWLETSKKNEKHPEGKSWIVLPNNNPTNRKYFSEDLFIETAENDEVTVEVKTALPRVLGGAGAKPAIAKYLSEEEKAEYENLVTNAQEAYRAAKANSKKKKLEDMTVEELEAYLAALQNGEKPITKAGPKSFMDMFTEEEYSRYNELLAIAQENKANAPKVKRGPLTDEEKALRKIKRKEAEINKISMLLEAARARLNGQTVEETDNDEDFE